MVKKKVLFCSNYCGLKTGFGGFIREIMSYLYKTGKYDLHLYAASITDKHPEFAKWPWKCYGALPSNQAELDALHNDQNRRAKYGDSSFQLATYGEYRVNDVIQEVKPDVYFAIEDPWGIHFAKDKPWWGKIPCVVHTTIDSRPIVKMAIDLAKSTPYFFSWADFATQEMQNMGLKNVKTLRGTVNTDKFKPLPEHEKVEIRHAQNIPEDVFCIGMCSRNQLRKSFPQVIEAYSEFRKKYPEIKARLLFFTHFSEGWNIPERVAEYGVDPSEVLAAYKCRATGEMFLLPFKGQDIDNPKTKQKGSLVTVNTRAGLTEAQLNQWYNILDVYVHAFTSGGQERTIQEAKLTELVTLVTNYSCGEDNCVEEAYSLPLTFNKYREGVSEFIKANTDVWSIVKNLHKVYKMTKSERREMGGKARKWVLSNFSIEVIGKQIEGILDSMPPHNYNFDFKITDKNPHVVIPDTADDRAWVKALYFNILNMDVADDDAGLAYWLNELAKSVPRANIENHFRSIAVEENKKNAPAMALEDILGKDSEPSERVLINMPESLGDCLYLTTLLRDAREIYAGKKIYVATKRPFMDVFSPLVGELIDGVIEWQPQMENELLMEGYGKNKGYFRVALYPNYPTQRQINYLSHGEKTHNLNLIYRDPLEGAVFPPELCPT